MMDQLCCRLCYEEPGTVPIYNMNNTDYIQTSAKIMYCCVNIKIAENDGLPASICISCEKNLTSFYDFILQCEAVDKKIRSLQEIEMKIEIKSEIDNNFADDIPDNSYEATDEIKEELDENIQEVYSKKVSSHKKRKIVSKIRNCKICGKKCANPSRLIIHLRSHSDERPYRCTTCNKSYKDSSGLKRHNERNHLEDKRHRNYICENCGKGFYSRNEMKIHMRIHTGETPYACTHCPSQFNQISSLQRHILRHTGVKTFSCSTCSKKFCTKNELQKHYIVHTDIKEFHCTICNSPFKYKNNLTKHLETHADINKFVCNYCGFCFNMKGNLKLHIQRMHSEKSGFCETCSKSVPNLKVHMWKHTGEKNYKCEFCGRSFSLLNGLNNHINFAHKHPDKFKCPTDGCLDKFPTRPMLEFHIAKLHKTGKPIQCDKCSRGFYRKSDLMRHIKGSHKQKIKQ